LDFTGFFYGKYKQTKKCLYLFNSTICMSKVQEFWIIVVKVQILCKMYVKEGISPNNLDLYPLLSILIILIGQFIVDNKSNFIYTIIFCQLMA